MGVEVAHNDRIFVVEVVEDGRDIEPVASGAGGDGRHVAVDDVERRLADVDGDGEYFQSVVVVGDVGDVDVSEGDGVVN